MKYKALFLDLDGTTIPNRQDGMPSPRVEEAIHKATAKLHVCVATSRTLAEAKPVLDHLDIRGFCVVTDSTQIYDPVRKSVLQTIFIDDIYLPQILDIAEEYSDHIELNSDKRQWVYKKERGDKRVSSVYIGSMEPKTADKLIEEMTKIPNIAVHKITSWEEGQIAVAASHAKATKLHGVETVAKMLGVQTHEMIGVGDGYNDFPLLMACGLKIAMGNAVPELKAIADFIAPTVEDDGVATVIEKFILQ